MGTLAQWIHVTAAVLGVGGMGFLLLIVLPSVRRLNPEQQDILMKAVLGRFRWVTWSAIALLLVSGVGNIRLSAWEAPWGTYWKWLTVKIVLAFFIFAIVFALTLPLTVLNRFRARRQLWLSIAFGLAIVVIVISAYLRRGLQT
jgi:uncharacterized membrane protein